MSDEKRRTPHKKVKKPRDEASTPDGTDEPNPDSTQPKSQTS